MADLAAVDDVSFASVVEEAGGCIRNLPTVLFFRDGAVVDQIVGAVPRGVYEAKLNELLAG